MQFFKYERQKIESATWRAGSSILGINSLGSRVNGVEKERNESVVSWVSFALFHDSKL